MDQYSTFVLLLQIVASFSVTSSTLAFINAVFLLLLQRSLDKASTLLPVSLAIIFICMGDSLSNGPYLSQYRPPSGSVDCTVSGFLHMVGYMITWMFTFYLAYVLYSISILERMPTQMMVHFTVCFGVPILFVGIQAIFGFSEYSSANYDVCLYTLHNEAQTVYHGISFWGLLTVICVGMIGMRIHEFLLEQKDDPRTRSVLFTTSKRMLQFYPVLLICCWIPTAIEMSATSATPQWFHAFAISMKIAHGLSIGIVYFTLGDQARKYFFAALNPCCWYALLIGDREQVALLGADMRDSSSMEVTMSMFEGNPSITSNLM